MEDVKKSVYEDFMSSYEESKYFSASTIVISYCPDIDIMGPNDKRKYRLLGIKLIDNGKYADNKKLKNTIKRCNLSIKRNLSRGSWQIFYLYKELLQTLLGDDLYFNYFRGQAGDYPLLPGVLRSETTKYYLRNFENIYKRMSFEFPDMVNYTKLIDDDSLNSRESDLSLLQHFGLKTSLLDITRNPYIAMLFMLRDSIEKYEEPTLYLFKINNNCDDDNKLNLFTEVKKSHINDRILAQKGAFLNFEKAILNKSGAKEVDTIHYVKIVLRLESEKYKNAIDKQFDLLNDLKNDLKNDKDLNKIVNDPEEVDEFLEKVTFIKEHMDEVQIKCLQHINDELSQKLYEYYYTKEDMFSDFENRIKYLSIKYKDETQAKKFH